MKILHLEYGYRAIRGERAAMAAKKLPVKQYLAGCVKTFILDKSLFRENIQMDISLANRLGFNRKKVRKQLKQIIKEIDPDVVHAHNIFMAELARELNVPFIYDDHELWSEYLKYIHRPNFKAHVVRIWHRWLYSRWEKKVGKNFPVITPSKGIVDFYKKRYDAPYVYKFPNMPALEEVKKAQLSERNKENLITVAIGVSTEVKVGYRRIDGFIELFHKNDEIGKVMIVGQKSLKSDEKVISTGRISHYQCYTEASKGHVGIIPFHPHPYHQFSGANKAYLYIHSGLVLITPKTQKEFHTITKEMGLGFHFMTYQEIGKYLQENREKLMNVDRKKIIKIAREKFVLDNYLNNLEEAYKIAIEQHT
jgi:hypothetical protein